jgi:amidohydrolase
VGAQIVLGLQTIVSRQSELAKAPIIITLGTINAGVRTNIIPDELTMTGTIRTLDKAMQKEVHQKIIRTAQKIAESAGATAEVSITKGYPVTFNDPALVKKMLPSLERAIGKENVSEREWVTGAEDFAFYGDKVPACFFFVGGLPKGHDPKNAPPHHSPDFFIDDSRLDVGVRAFYSLVMDDSLDIRKQN